MIPGIQQIWALEGENRRGKGRNKQNKTQKNLHNINLFNGYPAYVQEWMKEKYPTLNITLGNMRT